MKKELSMQKDSEVLIEAGDIVTINGTRFRVLRMNENVDLIELDTTKLILQQIGFSVLYSGISEGSYSVEKYTEPKTVIDQNNKKYQLRRDLILDILEKYGNNILDFVDHHSQSYLQGLMEKYHIKSKATLFYIVRIFLQSGCSFASLMTNYTPHKNRRFHKENCGCRDSNGRTGYTIKPSDIPFMNQAIKDYKSGTKISLQTAYNRMIDLHYTYIYQDEKTGQKCIRRFQYGHRPSFRQFVYYFYMTTSAEERLAIVKKYEKIRAENRPLFGSTLEYASCPGELVEIDACEIDLSLVSMADAQITVGRPTLYVMKDVYSKAIFAFSIGFGVNSTEALLKLFANLAAKDPKRQGR